MATTQQGKIHQSGERHLKIKSKWTPRAFNNNVKLPEISLTGVWLKSAGFEIGKKVIVRQEPNQLVITLADPEPETSEEQAERIKAEKRNNRKARLMRQGCEIWAEPSK